MRAGLMVTAVAAIVTAGAGLLAGCSASASPMPTGHGGQPSGASTAPAVGQPATGLTPAQLATAYNLGPLRRRGIDGQGQSIVIVDSFGSPTIAADLRAFDSAFGLRAPAYLHIVAPAGRVPAYQQTSTRSGWASETTLDVEWAHAMAPAAGIVLVETPTAENEGRTGFPQIVTAEEYAIRHHLGQVISQSFGATEQTFASRAALVSLRGAYLLADQRRYHVTVLAASGDDGASGETYNMQSLYPRRVVEWPASDPLVTAVGGTFMALTSSGARRSPDIGWTGSGGGRSVDFARPAYQNGVAGLAGRRRAIPDISMNASCGSSVAIYASYPGAGPHWQTICGTSEATPLFAGVVALADQVAGHSLGLINPALYQMLGRHDRGLTDVTKGSNPARYTHDGQPGVVPGFRARRGYDMITGTGTVNAAYFVPELAALAG
jgi:subtilase family serine protease